MNIAFIFFLVKHSSSALSPAPSDNSEFGVQAPSKGVFFSKHISVDMSIAELIIFNVNPLQFTEELFECVWPFCEIGA